MTDAVRRAGTGTARFDDPDWCAEVTFSLPPTGPASIRIAGQPYASSVRRVVDGTLYEGWTDLAGVWDERVLERDWLPGDPIRLIRSLPDGQARVVESADGTTTYLLTADEAALAAFCDCSHFLDDPEPGAATVRSLWTVDGQDCPVRVRTADDPSGLAWDDIRFDDWGSTAPVTAPPAVPAPPSGERAGPGERALHTLVVLLARNVAGRGGPWTSSVFVTGTHPTDVGADHQRVEARWWLLVPADTDGGTDGAIVHGDRWQPLETDHLTMTDRFVMAVATHHPTVSGRAANFLVIRLFRGADSVHATYGWTHEPGLTTPGAGTLLADPEWVSAAISAAEPPSG